MDVLQVIKLTYVCSVIEFMDYLSISQTCIVHYDLQEYYFHYYY